MRRVVILVTEVVLPIAVAIILGSCIRPVYVSEDGCNFLWLWIVVGFSIRYHEDGTLPCTSKARLGINNRHLVLKCYVCRSYWWCGTCLASN